MVAADFLCAVAAQHDLVGPEIGHEIGDNGEHEPDDESLPAADQLADEQKEAGHDAEEQRCFDCIGHS